jgi:para-aminobenzoate synthetase component 1
MTAAPEIIDLPYVADSQVLFARLRHLPGAVWLDSGKPRSLQGRFDMLSALPLYELTSFSGYSEFRDTSGGCQRLTDEPFSLAKDLLNRLGKVDESYANLPFLGGLIGYFAYDQGRYLHGLATDKVQRQATQRLGCYGWAVIVNHQSRSTRLVFHPAYPQSRRWDIRRLMQATSNEPTSSEFRLTEPFTPLISEEEYHQAYDRIQRYIQAGDCYQVNFAQPFSAPYEGDLWRAYCQLRHAMPSPYSAYLAWDDHAILSLSPERFLKVSLGQVEAKPIKGTIRRGDSREEDEQNAIALLNSNKDRAENLMIVDLLRNDLGRSCSPGSIRVPKLFGLESFTNVHHLVSTVTGSLKKDLHPIDLLKNSYPGGSITGAPKRRAMEIIDELEKQPRGAYCGSIGYISATGRMDTNIAIRTLEAHGNRLTCWGGGGIVSDSNAAEEYRESLQKVSLLMTTLEKMNA